MDSKRRMLIANAIKGGGILPSGYKECEYLESTETQYIDTEFSLTINSEIRTKFLTHLSTAYYNDKAVYGYISTEEYSNGVYFIPYSSKGYVAFGNQRDKVFNLDSSFYVATDYVHNKTGFWANGNLKHSFSNATMPTNVPYTYLFALNRNGNADRFANAKIYHFAIYDNGIIKVNLIPCLDNNDIPCMYDTVSKTTFYNAGTGTFLYQLKS